MPQQWRLYLYRRSCAGATPEELQQEMGLPADEIAVRVEAARLCFEKQCLIANGAALASSFFAKPARA